MSDNGSGWFSRKRASASRSKESKAKKPRARRSGIIALEPRMMYDGAGHATATHHYHDGAGDHGHMVAAENKLAQTPNVQTANIQAPPPPTITAVVSQPVSGGTVEVQGTGKAGETVKLYADGNTTTVVGTGKVGANGTFDITTSATFADGAHSFTATETGKHGTSAVSSAANVGANVATWVRNPTEIVFIDQQVPDYQALVAGVNPGTEVVLVSANSDGLQQIADFLSSNPDPNLTTIDILGHGQAGELTLGSTNLTDANLAGDAQALTTIGQALAPGGEIALYGCDVAQGDVGQKFIADLAVAAGGVRVAASTQDIGTLHGTNATFENWSLDASSAGPLDTSTPFTAAALASYQGLLAGATVTGSSITTTLTVDADGDGGISPGDTVTSQITITNTTSADATGTTLTENPTGLTAVPNSVEITPIAVNDTYNLVGNTPLTVNAANGLLANDIEFNGGALTFGSFTSGVTGGTVSVNSDGSFTFTPTTGFSGVASFSYVVHDAAGNSDQAATVTFNVSAPVWYVDSAAASGGDGSYGHAFQTVDAAWLAAANDSSAGVNNTIFVENAGATYAQTGGTLISLSNGEQLLGDGSSLTEVNGLAVGLSNANSTFSVSSGNAITLGSGNTISGIDITNTGSGQGIVDDGGSVGTLTMSNIQVTTGSGTAISIHHGGTVDITGTTNSINSTSGTALDIENTNIGSPGITFESISSGAGANDGIILSGTGPSGGLTITGDGSTAGSGGTIDGKTGTTGGTTNGIGIYLNNTFDVSIAYMQLDNLSYDGIYGQLVTNFSMDHTVVNGANGSATGEGSVIFGSGQYTGQTVQNGVTGVASITNSTISGGYYDNLDVFNYSGFLNITLNNDTFGDNNTTHGNQNVYIDPAGIAVINATVTNSQWIGVASGSNFYFDVESTSTTGSNLSFTDNTVSDNLGGAGGDGGSGIVEAIASSANGSTSTFDIENNAFSGANGSAVIIANDEAGSSTDTATLNLTFSGNTIGAAAGTHNPSTTDGFGSAGGIGLWVEFNGGTMNAMVANNYIYEVATNGIDLEGGLASSSGNDAGTLNATVIGNTIEDPSASAASKGAYQTGIYVDPGPNNGATNSYAFNLTIGGSTASEKNTLSVPQSEINAINAEDIQIGQDGDTHSPFAINLTAETATAGTLSAYSGPGDDTGQAVEAFLASNNSTTNTNGYFALAVTSSGYGGASPTATAPTSGPSFGTPIVSGIDTEGSTLSASVLGTSSAFQWQEAFSNGEWVDISGANLPNFTLTEAQVGATIRVVETSVYSGGLVDTVASAATATVADHLTVTSPFITGTDTVGQILTASTPTVDNSDATVTYQWEENSGSGFVAISGATGQTYRLAAGDVGDTIEVVVTATDPHGGDVSVTSGAVGTIGAFTAQSLPTVTIGTLPGNDAVTVIWKATVNAQSEQLIANPTYTGSITGLNFTTVSANGTVTLDALTLGGEIFGDTNGNGILDAGENGISGVSVSVFAQGGSTALETTTTNASGNYDFTGLAAGSYFVQVNASNFGGAAGYVNSSPVRDTTPNDYLGGRNYGLALSGGVVDTNAITIAYHAPHPTGATTYPGDDTTNTLSIGLITGPKIGAAGNTVDFYQSQGSTGTQLDSAITVTDATNITSATVTITAGYQSGDTLSFGTGNTETFGDGSIITATQSGGVLTLTTTSGNATAADYQTALESVKYDFTGDPTIAGTDATRTVAWSVTDTSGGTSAAGSSTTLDVFASPIVAVGAYTPPTVTASSGAVLADLSLGVTDYNGTTIAGATVAITAGAQSGDTLSFFNGTNTETFGDGKTISAIFSGTTLTLSGVASVADYAAALDQVQFDATTPHNGTRTLTWQVNDNAGGQTNKSVAVTTTANASFGPQITSVVGQPVNGGTVELDGTGVTVGDTINLYADGNIAVIVGTGTVGAGGTFDITTTKTYADGKHTFTAVETNASNPTIPLSPAFVVDVDPNAPAITAVVGQPVNGGTVDLQGTGEVGETVNLYADGGTTIVGTGTVGAGGTFDITTTATFNDGVHTFTAKEVDAASLTSTASTPAFTVDVNPNAPAITAVVGQPVNGGTVDLQGTGEVGETVNLYADGGTTIVGTGTVGAGGTFDITTTATFADGVHTFTAKEVDAASLTSTASTPAFTVDVNPNAPAITAVVGQPVNGGTVDLQGTGEVGETVNLYADGGTTIVGTGTVGAGGTFDITTTQTFNDGVHTFTAKEVDAASLTSAASAPAFTVDVDPTAPAITAVVGTPVNGGTVDLQGTGEVGDTVNLYADGGTTIVGTGTVGAGGTFDITTTATFADGVHTFTAKEVDAASLTSTASTPAFTVDVNPNAPAITAVVGTPVNGGTVDLQGTGEVGDTVNLYADGGTTIVGTGTVGAGGTFDITTTATFADGVHTFTAKEVDAASLTSTASTPAFTVDVNPNAPAITAVVGTPVNGGTVDLQGTGEVGDTVNLYADGGTTIVGTGTVGAGGTFDITTTATFADGVHTFTAKEVDAASLTSTASTPAFTVDVDPNAPAITAVVGQPVNGGTIDLQGTGEAGETVNLYADGGTTIVGTGTVAAGGTFDITTTATFADGVHSFTAKEVDAASLTSAASTPAFTVDVNPSAPAITAVVGQPVNGGTVDLQGTGEVGDTVNLYADGGTTIVGTGTVAAGGTFDITTTATYADGVHTFTAKETDAASLTSTASTPAFTVDVNPNAPAITAVVGQPVNGGTVDLQGTGEVGETVNLYADGGTTIVGTGTVGAGGTFDITTTATFADGVHTFTAKEVDAASLTSTASTPAFTVDVNPNAPAITAVVGQPVNGGTVDLQGTGEVGETVNLYADGGTTIVGTGTVGAGGTFDITTTQTFNDGVHTFTAKEVDATSLTSAASAPAFTVDVDPTAPAITAVVGTPVNGGTVDLQGTGEVGDTVNLYADGGTTIVGTGTVGAGGTFDITTTATFADGVHTFTAKEVDAASLTSTASTPAFTVDVNPNAPAITAVVGTPVNGGTVDLQGTGEVGDTVNLYADGGTTIVGTGTVAAGGTFDITTTATYADGVHTFTAKEVDAASFTSTASTPAFTVDVNPNAPAITAVVGQPVNGGTVDLQGTGEVGETVNLYADGGTTIVGTGTVGAGGTFDITTTATFADGVHTFTAKEVDAASLTSTASTPAFTVDVDPNAPAITAVVGQPVNGGTIDLQGTGEAGETVNLYADGGTTIVGTGTVAAGGTFDITTTATFADGVHTFTAKEVDAASLTSTASAPAFTVDVNPNAPAITAVVGTPVNGGTVDLQGTGEVGDTVNLYADGGTTIVGTGTVGAGGTFDITTTATFADGTHSFTAKEVDAASLTSTASTPAFTVGVESVAPTGLAQKGTATNGGPIEITGTGDAVGDLIKLYQNGVVVGTGTVGAGDKFDITTTKNYIDGSYTLTATDTSVDGTQTSTMSSPLTAYVNPDAPVITAVVGQPVNGGTVELQGTGEAGETVNLYADGGTTIVGTGIVGAGGTFDIKTTQTFADGVHTFTAKEIDAASLTSPASTPAFTVPVNPSAPAITTLVEVVIGGKVDLQGTGEAGETVKLYADGNTSTVVGTGTVDGSGHFDITTTASFATGLHTFTATETDTAGLTSLPSNTAFAVNVNLFTPQHVFTDNGPPPSLPNITLASLVGDVPRGSLLPVGDGFGTGTGGGFSFNVVHTDPVLTTASDANVQINLALASLEAPLGDDVVYVEARQADGKPLPDWLKFNPATGTFAGLPPENAVASLAPDLSSDNNIVTGTLKQDFNDGSGRHAPGSSSITIEVLARDSKGNVAVTVFTIDLQPHHAGQHGWNMQPFGVERHASLETLSPELAAIEAAVRDVTRPVEPFAVHDMPVRHGDTISVGGHETAPVGRAGLTEQLASIGWRSMAAQRNALLASLRQGR